MAAPKGNNYNLLFKTKKERQKVCDALVKHLEQGLSRDCFEYCDRGTIKHYIEKFPEDFTPKRIQDAEAKGMAMFEKIGLGIATGKIKGNPTAWIFMMKNKYRKHGWSDKVDQDVTSNGKTINLGLPASPFTKDAKTKDK